MFNITPEQIGKVLKTVSLEPSIWEVEEALSKVVGRNVNKEETLAAFVVCESIHPKYQEWTPYFLEKLKNITSVQAVEIVSWVVEVFGPKFVDSYVSSAGIDLYGEDTWDQLLEQAEEVKGSASANRVVADFLAEELRKGLGKRPSRQEIMNRRLKLSGTANSEEGTKVLDLFSTSDSSESRSVSRRIEDVRASMEESNAESMKLFPIVDPSNIAEVKSNYAGEGRYPPLFQGPGVLTEDAMDKMLEIISGIKASLESTMYLRPVFTSLDKYTDYARLQTFYDLRDKDISVKHNVWLESLEGRPSKFDCVPYDELSLRDKIVVNSYAMVLEVFMREHSK